MSTRRFGITILLLHLAVFLRVKGQHQNKSSLSQRLMAWPLNHIWAYSDCNRKGLERNSEFHFTPTTSAWVPITVVFGPRYKCNAKRLTARHTLQQCSLSRITAGETPTHLHTHMHWNHTWLCKVYMISVIANRNPSEDGWTSIGELIRCHPSFRRWVYRFDYTTPLGNMLLEIKLSTHNYTVLWNSLDHGQFNPWLKTQSQWQCWGEDK